jgi:hypothetical protein
VLAVVALLVVADVVLVLPVVAGPPVLAELWLGLGLPPSPPVPVASSPQPNARKESVMGHE